MGDLVAQGVGITGVLRPQEACLHLPKLQAKKMRLLAMQKQSLSPLVTHLLSLQKNTSPKLSNKANLKGFVVITTFL